MKGEGNPNSESFPEFIGVFVIMQFIHLKAFGILRTTQKKSIWHENKADLIFKLMIRQPEFADEEFATEKGVQRPSKIHREIYLTDA